MAPRLHSHCPPPERRPSKPSPDLHKQDTSLGWAGRTVGRNPSGSVTERQATLSDGTVQDSTPQSPGAARAPGTARKPYFHAAFHQNGFKTDHAVYLPKLRRRREVATRLSSACSRFETRLGLRRENGVHVSPPAPPTPGAHHAHPHECHERVHTPKRVPRVPGSFSCTFATCSRGRHRPPAVAAPSPVTAPRLCARNAPSASEAGPPPLTRAALPHLLVPLASCRFRTEPAPSSHVT